MQVDTLMVDLLPGDLFVLCSDGLHGYLADDELAPLTRRPSWRRCRRSCVDLANERGGKDNVTVVVVGISDAGAAPEELEETTSRMEVLKSIPLFRHLTYKEQTAILSIASTRRSPPSREIVTEGQPGDELYVVVRGRVRVGDRRGGDRGAAGRRSLRRDGAGRQRAAQRHRARRWSPPGRWSSPASELMKLMKRESILAVKLLWSFVQVLSDRLRATNTELSEARQELAAAQAVQPFTEE